MNNIKNLTMGKNFTEKDLEALAIIYNHRVDNIRKEIRESGHITIPILIFGAPLFLMLIIFLIVSRCENSRVN